MSFGAKTNRTEGGRNSKQAIRFAAKGMHRFLHKILLFPNQVKKPETIATSYTASTEFAPHSISGAHIDSI
jgi:hypothetical protein